MTTKKETILSVRVTISDLDKIADAFPEHVYTNGQQTDLLLDTICLETDEQLEKLRLTLCIAPTEFDWRHECHIVSHILFY